MAHVKNLNLAMRAFLLCDDPLRSGLPGHLS